MQLQPRWNEAMEPTLCMTLRGHHQGVRCLAFLPSLQSVTVTPRLISGSQDGSVLLWETAAATGRSIRFTGHRGPVTSVAQSPHTPLFASGGVDGLVKIWTPNLRRTTASYGVYSESRQNGSSCDWRAHAGATRAVIFAQDGSDRVLTGGDDKSVKAWDLHRAPSSMPWGNTSALANAFAGGFAATAVVGGGAGCGHTNKVLSLSVPSSTASPGFAHCVASGGEDGVIFVWDTRTRGAAHVLYGCGGPVQGLSYHPGGVVLASGDTGGDVNLFDLRRTGGGPGGVESAVPAHGALLGASYCLLQHYGSAHAGPTGTGVNSVAFSPNGGWLLSAGADGMTKLFDVAEGHLYCTVQAHQGAVAACAFSSDSAFFATGGAADRTVLQWRSGLAAKCATASLDRTNSGRMSNGSRGRPFEAALSSSTTAPASRGRRPNGQGMMPFVPRATSSQTPSVGPQHPSPPSSPASSSQQQQQRPPLPLAPSKALKSTAGASLGANAELRGVLHAVEPSTQVSEEEGDEEEVDARERSFERCERRYTHLGPIDAPSAGPSRSNASYSAPNRGTPARNSPVSQGRQTHQGDDVGSADFIMSPNSAGAGAAREAAHHREQESRITQERVTNLEDAMTALVAYMQRQEETQAAQLAALQSTNAEQQLAHAKTLAELKDALAMLVATRPVAAPTTGNGTANAPESTPEGVTATTAASPAPAQIETEDAI